MPFSKSNKHTRARAHNRSLSDVSAMPLAVFRTALSSVKRHPFARLRTPQKSPMLPRFTSPALKTNHRRRSPHDEPLPSRIYTSGRSPRQRPNRRRRARVRFWNVISVAHITDVHVVVGRRIYSANDRTGNFLYPSSVTLLPLGDFKIWNTSLRPVSSSMWCPQTNFMRRIFFSYFTRIRFYSCKTKFYIK